MARRLLDVIAAATALVVLAPPMLIAAIGVRLASPGPALYRCRRMGKAGVEFWLYKFRTMHVEQSSHASAITARDDPRVFRFGRLLRESKIDELPQLLNVLLGDMAIVGPRPEDPKIVSAHYTPLHWKTLEVLPGLASPGSLYNYTHGELLLADGDAERAYAEELLPRKLLLDLEYLNQAGLFYDFVIVCRTIGILAARLAGRRRFAQPQAITRMFP